MPPTPSSPPPPSNSSSSSCSSHHLMGGLLSPQGISSSNSVSGAWGVVSPGLYARSDSVTTSGLGSEISDSEMGQSRADLDALSLCSGMSGTLRGGGGSIAGLGFLESETDFSSLPPDDGVFTEPLFLPPPPPVRLQPPPRGGSARPSRPSSLLGKFNSVNLINSINVIIFNFAVNFNSGITPARDLEWKPSPSNSSASADCMTSLDTSPGFNIFPSLRKARPTSLMNPLDPLASSGPSATLGDLSASTSLSSGQDSGLQPGEK